MNYINLASEILKYVGGQENVISVTNCMTRLRFQLKDSQKAKVEAIKNLKGVQGAVTKNGQFQIIIGTDVSHVCEELQKLGHYVDNAKTVEEAKKPRTLKKVKLILGAPLSGQVISLSEVSDEAFSQGILGKGAAILPLEGKVYAPDSGKVETVFETKHAIGLVSDAGVKILIHVGMDTVELGGKYYAAKVKQGERVTKGQLLLEFDMEEIQKAGYDITTPIIVSNPEDYLEVLVTDKDTVRAKDDFLTILP
ncbi:glucose PTS transporter subunit IIA [Anaerocolumna sp. AGMB13020]|uniref:glucose PTS transporter subunit IIA n=1 Tax=Anaerocolumna sp. AGMB13020 TaxID=3081750 RepID=UPI002954D60B|nr:glucose PTS transporter subunit IIA [Anaerocolumna sp. AGMB13020]WOO37324.1 glucose PTS transporter subunit IIA [Anaerocolumna sp. AGMB13020]